MEHEQASHRFFAESVAGECVELPSTEAHHALHVMRLSAGDVVEVFDGSGQVVIGRLQPDGRKAASVSVTDRRSVEPPTGPAVTLAFAVPKGKRLDWLLEKATELGAASLAPVVFERSVVRPELTARTRERWRAATISAAKQCGAGLLPEIRDPQPIAEHLASGKADVGLLGDVDGTPLAKHAADVAAAESVTLLVGPEGGLTDAERSGAAEAGFIPVRVGAYTLRVETAATALLAAARALAEGGPLQIAPAR